MDAGFAFFTTLIIFSIILILILACTELSFKQYKRTQMIQETTNGKGCTESSIDDMSLALQDSLDTQNASTLATLAYYLPETNLTSDDLSVQKAVASVLRAIHFIGLVEAYNYCNRDVPDFNWRTVPKGCWRLDEVNGLKTHVTQGIVFKHTLGLESELLTAASSLTDYYQVRSLLLNLVEKVKTGTPLEDCVTELTKLDEELNDKNQLLLVNWTTTAKKEPVEMSPEGYAKYYSKETNYAAVKLLVTPDVAYIFEERQISSNQTLMTSQKVYEKYVRRP